MRTVGSIFSPYTGPPLKRRVRKKYATDYADLIVSGTLTPDVTGNYKEHGIEEGQPTYKKINELWFIWLDEIIPGGPYYWTINPRVGVPIPPYWEKFSVSFEPPTGIYVARSGAFGTATVSLP